MCYRPRPLLPAIAMSSQYHKTFCSNVSIWLSLYQGVWRVHFRDYANEVSSPRNHTFLLAENLPKLVTACKSLQEGEKCDEVWPFKVLQRASKTATVDVSPDGKYVNEVRPDPENESGYIFGSRNTEFYMLWKYIKIRAMEPFLDSLTKMVTAYNQVITDHTQCEATVPDLRLDRLKIGDSQETCTTFPHKLVRQKPMQAINEAEADRFIKAFCTPRL